jgi:hypothetical protein
MQQRKKGIYTEQKKLINWLFFVGFMTLFILVGMEISQERHELQAKQYVIETLQEYCSVSFIETNYNDLRNYSKNLRREGIKPQEINLTTKWDKKQ